MAKKGRPTKYDGIDLTQVQVAGELGLTDVEMCKFFAISKQTLNTYKKKYPDFLDSLKKGKEVADEKVVRALYRRATGYSHPDVHISNYQGTVTTTPIIKHYPPDVAACVYWLRNRQGWIDRIDPYSKEDLPEPPEFEKMSNQELDEFIEQNGD
jgi:hypothetical protein